MKYNVAIIGCGCISQNHIEAISENPMCELVAVCDIDEQVAADTATKLCCRYYLDYKKLLESDDIDAVHILTPHYLHTEMAIAALMAKKHVVLEKPVGISIDELVHIKEIADMSQTSIGVTLQNRYNPTSKKMKEIIDSKKYGNIVATKGIVTWHRDDAYYNQAEWRGRWDTEGGGLLINQAIHTIDLLQWLGGGATSLQGHIANHNHPNIEVEDTALATLYYENGGLANFYGTINHGEDSNIEIDVVFENGALHFSDNKLYVTVDNESTLVANDLETDGEKRYWGHGHIECIAEFYKAISQGEKPHISVKDAIVANEIVLGIYESSKLNKQYYMKLGD